MYNACVNTKHTYNYNGYVSCTNVRAVQRDDPPCALGGKTKAEQT